MTIQYLIWHTPRSGSNMLASMLSQTRVAGIANYEDVGFYVGLPDKWQGDSSEFLRQSSAYFDKQRTPNGVTGCKAGMGYFDEYRPIVGSDTIDRLLNSFTHHIFLVRGDLIAQGISRFIARTTDIWSTLALDKGISPKGPPEYDFEQIRGLIAKSEQEYEDINNWFDANNIEPLVVHYETMCREPIETVVDIIQFLGITDEYTWKAPIIRKQTDPLKIEYIGKYRKDLRRVTD